MFRTLVFTLPLLCSCQRAPCDELDVSNLSINTFFNTPSFSWVGDNINSLSVTDSNGEELWWLQCSGADQCLESPITYGESPVVEESSSLKATESAAELSAGESYTLQINIKCRGSGRNLFQEEEFIAP